MSATYRYGFYLRPDWATSRAVHATHRLLEAQYQLRTAGRFMPHATLKGFFRSAAEPDTMIARLDRALAGWRSFPVFNNGMTRFGPRSIVVGLRCLPDGSPNLPLFDLHERAWLALEPLIDPACEFVTRDPRGRDGDNPFHPHLTLAMADLRPELQDEVFSFIAQGGPVGPPQFTADTVQLFRFTADWDKGWHHTLHWELLHSWRASP